MSLDQGRAELRSCYGAFGGVNCGE